MTIRHKQSGNKGLFFIQEEGDEILAEMVYLQREPNTMVIEHTEVDDRLRGQNIGFQLVQSGVQYARSHGMKIIPMCPFARGVIDKKPEFQDVLA